MMTELKIWGWTVLLTVFKWHLGWSLVAGFITSGLQTTRFLLTLMLVKENILERKGQSLATQPSHAVSISALFFPNISENMKTKIKFYSQKFNFTWTSVQTIDSHYRNDVCESLCATKDIINRGQTILCCIIWHFQHPKLFEWDMHTHRCKQKYVHL